jgi:GDP-4-dehydro-6-deoxy-D-mannose reductase
MNELDKIIITGINGFVGEHLAQYLNHANIKVTGVGREPLPANNVAPYLDQYKQIDMLVAKEVDNLSFKNVKAVIHLAGLASVAESFDKPELYKNGNAAMTENILAAAKEQNFKGRVVAISTGALYSPSQPMPLNETSQTTEGSPYATGKLRAEAVIKKYIASGIDAVIVRPFNHIGPGQGPGFLVGDLYDQLSSAASDNSSEIHVGNLATKRDYTDVRDIVKAYTLLAKAPELEHVTYNIASGKSYSGFEILDLIKKSMSLESIHPVVDPSRVRPTDAQDIIGDTSRIRDELGWSPEIDISTTINDFVIAKRA